MVISEQIDSEMTVLNCFTLLETIPLFKNPIRPPPCPSLSLLALISQFSTANWADGKLSSSFVSLIQSNQVAGHLTKLANHLFCFLDYWYSGNQ